MQDLNAVQVLISQFKGAAVHRQYACLITVEEAEGVGNGIPHSPDGPFRSAMALEPVCEANIVESSYTAHATLRVYQRSHYWGCS